MPIIAFVRRLHAAPLSFAVVVCMSTAMAAPAPRVAELQYDGRLYGLKVGEARARLATIADGYTVEIDVAASGIAGLFMDWGVGARSEGLMLDGVGVQPIEHLFKTWDRGKHQHLRLAFAGDEPEVVDADPHPDGEDRKPMPPGSLVGALDPVSAGWAAAAAVGRSGECAAIIPAYDGRQRFDLILEPPRFDAVRDEDKRIELYRLAIGRTACSFRIRWVAGLKRKYVDGGETRRPIQGHVWLQRVDEALPPVPVRVHVETELGTAVLALRDRRGTS